MLEGGVQEAGEQVRVNAQLLVDATTGAELWVERYDRLLRVTFFGQDEIVRPIVTSVRVKWLYLLNS